MQPDRSPDFVSSRVSRNSRVQRGHDDNEMEGKKSSDKRKIRIEVKITCLRRREKTRFG
jgi:hypothetical protein